MEHVSSANITLTQASSTDAVQLHTPVHKGKNEENPFEVLLLWRKYIIF